jgi:hypothetical protein
MQAAALQSARAAPGVLHAQGLEPPTQTLRHVTMGGMHRRQGRASAGSALRDRARLRARMGSASAVNARDGVLRRTEAAGYSFHRVLLPFT